MKVTSVANSIFLRPRNFRSPQKSDVFRPTEGLLDALTRLDARGMLTGIEIRLFLVIDAFSRFSGIALACSADLSLALAKQLLDSTAAGSSCGRGPTGPTSRPAPGAPSGTRLSPPELRGSSSPPTSGTSPLATWELRVLRTARSGRLGSHGVFQRTRRACLLPRVAPSWRVRDCMAPHLAGRRPATLTRAAVRGAGPHRSPPSFPLCRFHPPARAGSGRAREGSSEGIGLITALRALRVQRPSSPPASLELTRRFRLTPCSAARIESVRCSSGGILTRNSPL